MAVQSRALARFGLDVGQVKIARVGDGRLQPWILGHAFADHVVNEALMAGNLAVDKSLFAGLQLFEARHPPEHLFFGDLQISHIGSPLSWAKYFSAKVPQA